MALPTACEPSMPSEVASKLSTVEAKPLIQRGFCTPSFELDFQCGKDVYMI